MIDRLWNTNLGLRVPTEVGNSKVCIPEHHHRRPYQATTAQFVSFLLCWSPLLCFFNFLVGALTTRPLWKIKGWRKRSGSPFPTDSAWQGWKHTLHCHHDIGLGLGPWHWSWTHHQFGFPWHGKRDWHDCNRPPAEWEAIIWGVFTWPLLWSLVFVEHTSVLRGWFRYFSG